MKKLPLILLIIGILVGISPIVGQFYTKYQERKMMDEWLSSAAAATTGESVAVNPEEGLAQLQEGFASDSGNPGEVTAASTVTAPEQTSAAAEPAKPAVKQTVLGIITIKKIKVNLPVVEGVKAANLRAGVGHMPGTAALGSSGNSALAGHRNYSFGRFFNRLDELVIGDEIIITTKEAELRYKIIKKFVVTPDDVSILNGKKDENIITLITCTPIRVATHRLIVQASLEERIPK